VAGAQIRSANIRHERGRVTPAPHRSAIRSGPHGRGDRPLLSPQVRNSTPADHSRLVYARTMDRAVYMRSGRFDCTLVVH